MPGKVLRQTPNAIAEKLKALVTQLGVYVFPGDLNLGSRREVEHLADQLQKAAEVLAGSGHILAYHNHAMEFRDWTESSYTRSFVVKRPLFLLSLILTGPRLAG
ncbi:MAG: hypothetical protein JO333_21325 [Verrucomicrobia bacterium]|nr:hypothetical protein [Verrucomicrobiota bacterium]